MGKVLYALKETKSETQLKEHQFQFVVISFLFLLENFLLYR